MKFFSICLMGLVLSQNLLAEVTGIKLKSPFLIANCTKEQLGLKGIKTESVIVKDLNDSVSISVINSMQLCSEQDNKFSFKKVDPFKGFNASYFNFKTNKISEKTEIINASEAIDLIVFDDLRNSGSKARMSELSDGTFGVTIEINKDHLFTQDENELLNSNVEITKGLVLSTNAVMTTIVGNDVSDQTIGEERFSGRNLFITFKKINNQLKVSSAKF